MSEELKHLKQNILDRIYEMAREDNAFSYGDCKLFVDEQESLIRAVVKDELAKAKGPLELFAQKCDHDINSAGFTIGRDNRCFVCNAIIYVVSP